MNHAYLKLKGRPDPEKVDEALRTIVRERWGDLVEVERKRPTYWWVGKSDAAWFGLSIWVSEDKKRSLEFRKNLGDFSSWLQTFIQESLAIALNGVCSDQGHDRKWEGKPEDFRTFRQWFNMAHSHSGLPKIFVNQLYRTTVKNIPKEIL